MLGDGVLKLTVNRAFYTKMVQERGWTFGQIWEEMKLEIQDMFDSCDFMAVVPKLLLGEEAEVIVYDELADSEQELFCGDTGQCVACECQQAVVVG